MSDDVSRDLGKRICLQKDVPYQPLLFGLDKGRAKSRIHSIYCNEEEAAYKLKEGEVDLGIISSLAYAQKKESWRIIPGIALSFLVGSNAMLLFFRKGLKEINRVAINASAITANVLLKIILQEKFKLSPEYISIDAPVDEMLTEADAALLTGSQAMRERRPNRLDLCEEWYDLTGHPFVYAFWAGLEIGVTAGDVALIKQSHHLGMKNLENISKKFAQKNKESWAYYHDIFTRYIRFEFNDREKQALQEFYNYAFYYGFSEFIPDLLFYD